MKKLLAVLLALLQLWSPALAATNPPLCGCVQSAGVPSWSCPGPACQPYYQFKTSDRSKHIMVIRPSVWDLLFQPNVLLINQGMHYNFGNVLEAAEKQGLEVHYYDTKFFESDLDHREMWSDAGRFYSMAIVLWPTNTSLNPIPFSRYVCADSTNVQLVVCGTAGGSVSWQPDTATRGFVDNQTNGYEAVSATNPSTMANGAFLVTNDGVDTLFARGIPSGRRILDATLSGMGGISQVVRLVRPGTTTGTAFVTDAESVRTAPPGSIRTGWLGSQTDAQRFAEALAADGRDSVAASFEYLGPMWRVDFAHGLTVDAAARTYLNSLGTNVPKSTYWIKFPAGQIVPRANPQELWALICRFTTAAPITYGYDWDDVADKFVDSRTGQPPRWRQTAADSSLKGLAQLGIVPTMMVNPGHLAAYAKGAGQIPYTDQTATTDTSAHEVPVYQSNKWIVGYHMVNHAHDSTQASIASNVVGGFGGYAAANGSNALDNGTGIAHQIYGYRLASAWQPTFVGNPATQGNGSNGMRWGIVQRLNWSDSVFVANGGQPSPNYICQPANEILPRNWRARNSINSWRMLMSDAPSCPVDSLMWAFDTVLTKGNGRGSGNRLWFRNVCDNPRGNYVAGLPPLGVYQQWDRDSVIAGTPFLYSKERLTIPVSGRLVQAVSAGCFLQGADSRPGYMINGYFRVAMLLGLKNPAWRSDVNNPNDNEAFNNDSQNILAVGAPAVGFHDFGFLQSTRIVYQHPGQHGDTFTANGDYHVDCFIRSMGTQLHMLDTIAGRPTSKCVPGWQVY